MGISNMSELRILRGLPASGKSTYALDLVQFNTNWIRVNKDEFRNMLYDGRFVRSEEDLLNELLYQTIKLYLSNGYSVVSDNLNLDDKHWPMYLGVIDQVDSDIRKGRIKVSLTVTSVIDFDTSLGICLDRNICRHYSTNCSNKAIVGLHDQYLKDGWPSVPEWVSSHEVKAWHKEGK